MHYEVAKVPACVHCYLGAACQVIPEFQNNLGKRAREVSLGLLLRNGHASYYHLDSLGSLGHKKKVGESYKSEESV